MTDISGILCKKYIKGFNYNEHTFLYKEAIENLLGSH